MTTVEQIKMVRMFREQEGLSIREIVRRLNLSRNTVRRILRTGVTELTYQRQTVHQPVTGTIRDLVKQWVQEDLAKPRHKERRTAWRIYEQLQGAHQYHGCYKSISKLVKLYKKEYARQPREAFVPLLYNPGEAFQFDWFEFNAILAGKLTTVQVAVVILCHSRYFYARAYLSQKQELLFDAHLRAFTHFGGTCQRGIYDNLKTAVKRVLKGNHRNLQQRFVQFTSHYLYEPQFCNPAKGNEKGRVEKQVSIIERNFFVPIQQFSSLTELNDRLLTFCVSYCHNRPHPEDQEFTRHEKYLAERDSLVQLPPYPFENCRTACALVTPMCTVFFDNNKYSVPSQYVGKTVLVKGFADRVLISCNGHEIAAHQRSFNRNEFVYEMLHYLPLLATKPGSFRDGYPFKRWAMPEIFRMYRRHLKNKFGADSDRYFIRTLLLLCSWKIKDVSEAMYQAIKLGVYSDSYILSLLRQKENPHPVPAELVTVREALGKYKATQQPLMVYDQLARNNNKKKAGD